MARRISTSYKPFRVASNKIVNGRVSSYAEDFTSESEARKRAEKLAKIRSITSVYFQKIDEDGYITENETVKSPKMKTVLGRSGTESSE